MMPSLTPSFVRFKVKWRWQLNIRIHPRGGIQRVYWLPSSSHRTVGCDYWVHKWIWRLHHVVIGIVIVVDSCLWEGKRVVVRETPIVLRPYVLWWRIHCSSIGQILITHCSPPHQLSLNDCSAVQSSVISNVKSSECCCKFKQKVKRHMRRRSLLWRNKHSIDSPENVALTSSSVIRPSRTSIARENISLVHSSNPSGLLVASFNLLMRRPVDNSCSSSSVSWLPNWKWPQEQVVSWW